MSEIIDVPSDTPPEIPPGNPPTMALPALTPEASSVAPPVHVLPPGPLAPDLRALLDVLARGLATDADEATRATARDLHAQLADAVLSAASTPAAPAAPMPLPFPPPPFLPPPAPPMMPPPFVPLPSPPMSPIAMAARAVSQGHMTMDQLWETAIQRLRSALPAGATVATPRGIQFQLVPLQDPAAARSR